MITVFLDASGMVPMEVRRDQWYPRLRRIVAGLRASSSNVTYISTNWTLYEALAITQRAGKDRALALHARITELANVITVSPEVEREALRRFLTWTDKGASVVDHANLLVAQAQGCHAFISFDDDFVPLVKGTGIRLL